MSGKKWTTEEIILFKQVYRTEPVSDTAKRFKRSVSACWGQAKKLGLVQHVAWNKGKKYQAGGRSKDAQFKKGHATWNKGMKGLQCGGKETQFKKGNLPHTTLPVGSYRITKDGTLQRKVGAEPGANHKRWRSVHELVWIDTNGPVPPKHICVFKPGMKTTNLDEITLDRIDCISFAENMRRNSYHNNYPKEIKLAIQLTGAVNRQINKRLGKPEKKKGRPKKT